MAKKRSKPLSQKLKGRVRSGAEVTEAMIGKRYILGEIHIVEGIECQVSYINHGTAWLTPTRDHAPLIARHIAFATINEEGKVKKI